MTKAETLKFLNKIKVYYSTFSLEDYVKEEWIKKLKDYDLKDVEDKFDEHLKGDRAEEPPKLHFITRYLKTTEEKEKIGKDYIIYCNLCGKEMYLSTYDNEHYDKCLMIKTLIPILKKQGNEVTYDDLDEYDSQTLEKLIYKYLPIKKDMSDLM